jgi:REP element-mobilizing transposase RayT
MRNIQFANGEYYHIFNRGNNKRDVFMEQQDILRFFQGMVEFNSLEPIGSIFENSFRKNLLGHSVSKLVGFNCYCLNSNHYHFILRQIADKGVEKFMHRLGNGYTKYFNNKYNGSGSLFQGRYKAIHIDSNDYLLHLSAYVNLNNTIHRLGHSVSKSSWDEYVMGREGVCEKKIIMDQFRNIEDYKKFAENSIELSEERKDIERFLLE